jgi:hypothetical protein
LASRLRRSTEQRDLEPQHDSRGDLVLHGEDVVERAIVGFRQKVRVGACIDELHRDAQPVARLAHRAFEDVRNVEPFRDLDDVDVFALERECRRARSHVQRGNLREQIQQFLGQPVGHVSLILVRGHVDEGQYGDRLIGNRRRCVVRIPVQHEAVREQQHDGDSQRCNDQAIEFLAGVMGDRFIAIDFALAFESLRRDFVEPREQQQEREADDRGDDDDPHRPVRKIEEWKDLRRDLDYEPRGCSVKTPPHGKRCDA